MVPKIPSCHYMLLMQPSGLKFISNQFHFLYTYKNNHCHRVTTELQLINIIIIIIISHFNNFLPSAVSSSQWTVPYLERVFACFLLRQLRYLQLSVVEYVG